MESSIEVPTSPKIGLSDFDGWGAIVPLLVGMLGSVGSIRKQDKQARGKEAGKQQPSMIFASASTSKLLPCLSFYPLFIQGLNNDAEV